MSQGEIQTAYRMMKDWNEPLFCYCSTEPSFCRYDCNKTSVIKNLQTTSRYLNLFLFNFFSLNGFDQMLSLIKNYKYWFLILKLLHSLE